MKYFTVTIFLLFMTKSFSQKEIISFDTNGLNQVNMVKNPFKEFIGEWTLKDNKWIQNWGNSTDTLAIPKHHTISTQINTTNSLFSIIDGPEPNGHIFWSYNPVTKKINHLSSFGELRAGVGEGSISKNGDITLKIFFEGEPKDTYRVYNYRWISKNEYHMKSVQFDASDNPTGLFYEGHFVRLDEGNLKNQIEEILVVLDDTEISVEEQLKVYADDVVHMAPGYELNIGTKALGNFLKNQKELGVVKMKHEIFEFERLGSLVIMRGEVRGTFHPKNETTPREFRTKNLFVFEVFLNELKINKVIYNSSPIEKQL
ncbi:hypothetical protein FEE95_13085 [Maribacter algarum]|uniref:Uncharacterized protein n=1 Tax=Maribacter algarum (ex Zhang et al. 2020) TaxID=2578118 RepID=A0A5S3PU12_9FLAO|nr:hypothetical protein [Maribacter algarum]TMM57413.1 hypothetical protein FEE95_13085 [Maribacter algarum]